MSSAEVKSCEQCGASIYPEHIGSNKAGVWSGRLYCVHCYAEHRNQQVTLDPDDFAHSSPTAAKQTSESSGIALEPESDIDPLGDLDIPSTPALVEDDPIALTATPTTIKPFTSGTKSDEEQHRFQRPLQHDGAGATRCRIYHAKLNDGALKFMQEQINEWIDEHADIEIKHVSTQVGIIEGKSSEPHLIMTLFY